MKLGKRLQPYVFSLGIAAGLLGNVDASFSRKDRGVVIEVNRRLDNGYTVPSRFLEGDLKRFACLEVKECTVNVGRNSLTIFGIIRPHYDVDIVLKVLEDIDGGIYGKEDKKISDDEITKYRIDLYIKSLMKKLDVDDKNEIINYGGFYTTHNTFDHILDYFCIREGQGSITIKDKAMWLHVTCNRNKIESSRVEDITKLLEEIDLKNPDGIITIEELIESEYDYYISIKKITP